LAPWGDEEGGGLTAAWIRLWDYGRTRKWDPKNELPAGHRIEHRPECRAAPVLVSVEFESAPRRPYWIQVGGEYCPHKFVALPPGGKTSFLVVQKAAADQRVDPLWVVTEGGDPQADIVLGYLTGGLMEQARLAGRDLLADARRSGVTVTLQPQALLVAGYALLQCEEIARGADDVGWITRLYSRHNWSADAAVIRGWMYMKSRTPDLAVARDCLLEAVRRGVPQFAVGLRLLFDGLDLLHELGQRRDDRIAEARRAVSGYLRAADSSSPMTSFYARLPDGPDSEWVWGPPRRGDPPAIEIGKVSEPQFI
jgi:hypothetical protein